jgi:hypothetical protein
VAKTHCQNCGESAARSYDNWLLCEKCAVRFEEQDQRWAEYQAGLITWNTSQHDPFWRGWLKSWELFTTIRTRATAEGQLLGAVADGEVFECLRGVYDPWLRVWRTETEVIVAYQSTWELPAEDSGLQVFHDWAAQLRQSAPLELGLVRDGSSYGAVSAGVGLPPVVKWAQAGDWAAMIRTWFVEGFDTRPLAPWP